MKSKKKLWKPLLPRMQYLFLSNSYVCPIWISRFDTDQALINIAVSCHKEKRKWKLSIRKRSPKLSIIWPFENVCWWKLHCNEDPIYVFLEMKFRGLVPNFDIHVPVIDLYIPTIGPPIFCSKIWGPIVGILYIDRSQNHEYENWERDRAVSFLGIFLFEFSEQCLFSVQVEVGFNVRMTV